MRDIDIFSQQTHFVHFVETISSVNRTPVILDIEIVHGRFKGCGVYK